MYGKKQHSFVLLNTMKLKKENDFNMIRTHGLPVSKVNSKNNNIMKLNP